MVLWWVTCYIMVSFWSWCIILHFHDVLQSVISIKLCYCKFYKFDWCKYTEISIDLLSLIYTYAWLNYAYFKSPLHIEMKLIFLSLWHIQLPSWNKFFFWKRDVITKHTYHPTNIMVILHPIVVNGLRDFSRGATTPWIKP